MKRVINSLSALIITLVFSSAFAADSIMVHDAWVRTAPPNAKVLAAYMIIENNTDEPRSLTGAFSKRFKKIEIHRTEIHEGMMKMVPQKRLNIPAHGSVSLAPAGYHLMLKEPKSVPKEGEMIALELRFDDGKRLYIKVPVRDEENNMQ